MQILIFFSFFCFVFLYSVKLNLKWKWKGTCSEQQCEYGKYSSPAFLERNGKGYIFGTTQSVFSIDVETGNTLWSHATEEGSSEVFKTHWASPGLYNESNGDTFVVTTTQTGWVCKFNAESGSQVWCKKPDVEYGGYGASDSMFRGVTLGRLRKGTGDNNVYIFASNCCNGRTYDLLYILDHNGGLVESLPTQAHVSPHYCHSVGNQNVAVYDLDGDGNLEIMLPCDNSRVFVYDHDFTCFPISSKFVDEGGTDWCDSRIWREFDIELKGWPDPEEESTSLRRTNHHFNAVSPFTFEGKTYIARTGNLNVFGGSGGMDSSNYGLFISEKDKMRGIVGSNKKHDWSKPAESGSPVTGCHDCGAAYWVMPNIAVYDIDGDGYNEFIWPSLDGKIHCNWMNRKEKHFWPFQLGQDKTNYRLGSEVAIYYKPGYGSVVIAASWNKASCSDCKGYLHFINARGRELKKVTLPLRDSGNPDSSLPAPTLFFFKKMSKNLFVTVQTKYSGVMLYEIDDCDDCHILWGTGRGSFFRDGYTRSTVKVNDMPALFSAGEIVAMVIFPLLFVCCFVIACVVLLVLALFPIQLIFRKKGKK